jgi:L-alanine-DL-glutamate epimerase-like enolase superfamily enzyme
MKISDITGVVVDRPWASRLGMTPGRPGVVPWGVLTITTDDGLEGHGALFAPGANPAALAGQIMATAKPGLIGRDPLDIGAIWAEHWARRRFLGGPIAVGAIDMALWDIAGKAMGQPVHRLLGTHRDTVPIYKSDPVTGPPEEVAEDVIRWRELGWGGYKYHSNAGRPDRVDHDLAVLPRVREAAGDEMRVMFDAHAYRLGDAVRVGKAIEALGYTWYEDPLPPDDLAGHRRLREQVGIPIVATEVTEGGLYTFAPWIVERATDALRGDWAVKGGITAMIKAAHLAEAHYLAMEVHDGYGSLGNLANLHVIMATATCTFFEGMTFNPPGETGLERMNFGLTDPIEPGPDGLVRAPTKPGLGSDIDWEAVGTTNLVRIA